jgi:hypothetical protein
MRYRIRIFSADPRNGATTFADRFEVAQSHSEACALAKRALADFPSWVQYDVGPVPGQSGLDQDLMRGDRRGEGFVGVV